MSQLLARVVRFFVCPPWVVVTTGGVETTGVVVADGVVAGVEVAGVEVAGVAVVAEGVDGACGVVVALVADAGA